MSTEALLDMVYSPMWGKLGIAMAIAFGVMAFLGALLILLIPAC